MRHIALLFVFLLIGEDEINTDTHVYCYLLIILYAEVIFFFDLCSSVSQQFAHYQLVARLFKRWLSSQLVLYHFDSINADLICCYVFLHSTSPPKY